MMSFGVSELLRFSGLVGYGGCCFWFGFLVTGNLHVNGVVSCARFCISFDVGDLLISIFLYWRVVQFRLLFLCLLACVVCLVGCCGLFIAAMVLVFAVVLVVVLLGCCLALVAVGSCGLLCFLDCLFAVGGLIVLFVILFDLFYVCWYVFAAGGC